MGDSSLCRLAEEHWLTTHYKYVLRQGGRNCANELLVLTCLVWGLASR